MTLSYQEKHSAASAPTSLSNVALFNSFRAAVAALQHSASKHTRAHQTLPRWRRRRSMSYDFHRMPQALRPRALRETGSSSLIFAKNAPKASRKHRRARAVPAERRFLARRMKFLGRVPYRNTQKVLRRVQQIAVLPRSTGYVLFYLTPSNCASELGFEAASNAALAEFLKLLNGTLYARRVLILDGIPVEIFAFGQFSLALVYEEHADAFAALCAQQNVPCSVSCKKHQLLSGNVDSLLGDCVKDHFAPSENAFANNSQIVQIQRIIDPLLADYRPIRTDCYDALGDYDGYYLRSLPLGSPIETKFMRCIRPKREYCAPRALVQEENREINVQAEFILFRERSFSFVFIEEKFALHLMQKLVRAGVPLAGALERRFLQFESRTLDLQCVRRFVHHGGERSVLSSIKHDTSRTQKHHLHAKSALRRDEEEMFIKWLLTDIEDWQRVKGETLYRYQARRGANASQDAIQPDKAPDDCDYQAYLDMGFEEAQKGISYSDKCYCLHLGREIGMRAGLPRSGELL